MTSDPENFSAIPTHMMNICGKFRDIAASEIGVNRRTTDRRKYNLKPIRPPPPIVGGGRGGIEAGTEVIYSEIMRSLLGFINSDEVSSSLLAVVNLLSNAAFLKL